MVVNHHLVGYDHFCEFLNTFDSKDKPVYVYFTGSKDTSGQSWCSDCNAAWPNVEKEVAKLPEEAVFVLVEVGDRETWKNPSCLFRKDPKTKLMVVPTLIRWNGKQKLEGEQCEKPDLLSLLLEYEDDD